MNNVSVRDARSAAGDRRWMEGVYREYLNDLAPQATGIFPVLGEFGHREPDQLGGWFADNRAHVLTILYGADRAGFARVRVARQPAVAGSVEYSMAEFFIAHAWRRRGIGAQAARLILDRFTGRWEITEHQSNGGAVDFWRRVVSDYSGGKYQERLINGEVQQRFDSGVRRPR